MSGQANKRLEEAIRKAAIHLSASGYIFNAEKTIREFILPIFQQEVEAAEEAISNEWWVAQEKGEKLSIAGHSTGALALTSAAAERALRDYGLRERIDEIEKHWEPYLRPHIPVGCQQRLAYLKAKLAESEGRKG